jgi:threonine dehydratase
VLATEVETAAPFAASLGAGRPVDVDRTPSFVDGIGCNGVLPEMWPLASRLLRGSIVVPLEDVCEAIRDLVRHARVVAEGAGACAVAAARTLAADEGPVVAVVSGGNIDTEVLAAILEGATP